MHILFSELKCKKNALNLFWIRTKFRITVYYFLTCTCLDIIKNSGVIKFCPKRKFPDKSRPVLTRADCNSSKKKVMRICTFSSLFYFENGRQTWQSFSDLMRFSPSTTSRLLYTSSCRFSSLSLAPCVRSKRLNS